MIWLPTIIAGNIYFWRSCSGGGTLLTLTDYISRFFAIVANKFGFLLSDIWLALVCFFWQSLCQWFPPQHLHGEVGFAGATAGLSSCVLVWLFIYWRLYISHRASELILTALHSLSTLYCRPVLLSPVIEYISLRITVIASFRLLQLCRYTIFCIWRVAPEKNNLNCSALSIWHRSKLSDMRLLMIVMIWTINEFVN